MKRVRGLFLAVLAAVLAVVLPLQAGASAPVTVSVRGTAVQWTDAQPYLENGRTMVPLRDTAQAMGMDVYWDGAERRVDVTKTYTPQNSIYRAEVEPGQTEFMSQRTVSLWIGKEAYTVSDRYAIYDGKTISQGRQRETSASMDVAAEIRQSRTYVPIRYVAEQFGNDVLWDAAARTVQIVAEVTADWSYAWSISGIEETTDPGSLILAVHSPVNLTHAKILSVKVACTPEAGSSDGEQKLLHAGTADLHRIQSAAGASVQLLDTVRVEYPFQKGKTYTIAFTLSITKSNGAVVSSGSTFQVSL